MKTFIKNGLKTTLALASSALLVSCGSEQDPGLEFAPDMYHSVPLDPFSQIEGNYSKYNPQGMNMRMPVQGSVARGKMGYTTYISKDSAEVAGRMLQNPVPYSEEVLADGKVLYARYCDHCHGDTGEGDGLVGQKFKGVPSYTAGRVAELPMGHVYHVITFGKGRMMPHASQISPVNRWKIAMYVQTLQKGGVVDTVALSAASAQPATNAASVISLDNVNPVTGYMYDGNLRK